MALPRIVEYLLTLRRPGDSGPLVTEGMSQTIIPIMPPGTTVTLQVYPAMGDYMNIVFQSALDPSVVPSAFYGWGSYFGARLSEGILHSWWTRGDIPSFVFITEAEPAYALIFNRSPIAQYYAGTTSHLSIKSEDDYLALYEAIERMGTSRQHDALVVESNNLLRQIVNQGLVAPLPATVRGGA